MGDRIELAIRRSGMTLAEVAEKAEVGAPWLSSAKQDRMKNPDWLGLKKVAEVCGYSLAYFLEPVLKPLGVIPMDANAVGSGDFRSALRSMKGLVNDDIAEALITVVEATIPKT
jgi:transcriptional regulator with XRE-family HTH domain